jgi:uncharacterized protein (DUF924 family)
MKTPTAPATVYEPVLQFWFGDGGNAVEIAKRQADLWWGKSPTTDAGIRERFGALRELAVQGELDAWEESSRGRLALILLVDQMSRNIFRDQLAAFTYDYLAQEWCLDGLDLGVDEQLQPIERVFFYLPLEHSESRVDQVRSVALFSQLAQSAPEAERELFAGYVDFAKRHQGIVERFDRFPHRNRILGRESTPEEVVFLQQPGSSF